MVLSNNTTSFFYNFEVPTSFLSSSPSPSMPSSVNPFYVLPASLLGTPNTPRPMSELAAVAVASSLTFATMAITVRNIVPREWREWRYVSRYVAMPFPLLCTPYCMYTAYLRYRQSNRTTGSFLYHIGCMDQTPLADEQFANAFAAGYFLYDTIGMFTLGYYKKVFFIHHVISLSAVALALLSGFAPSEVTMSMGLFEVTGSIVNLRWMLQQYKYHESHSDSWLWFLCDRFYIALFGFCRFVLLGWALVSFLACPTAPVVAAIPLFLLQLGSLWFFVRTVKQMQQGVVWVHG